jgi:hypothetical protein
MAMLLQDMAVAAAAVGMDTMGIATRITAAAAAATASLANHL